MNNKKIWISLAKMSGREIDFVREAFETNCIAPFGPNINAFEKELTEYLGDNGDVVVLNSGTAALHLGLIQLGVQNGDEVICQSFTFAASANPITYVGAQPVFIDSEEETWNMDPALLERAIKDRYKQTGKYPKAVIPVHLYGMPAQMDEILTVCTKYNISVLEDAAEAMGSRFKGQKCGTFGDFGVLSFNGNKMITTSGGGALVCPTKEAAVRTKFYATQARDKGPHYQHSEIGYNYRMSNICAGIGRGQMLAIDSFIARRREIHAWYKNQLAEFPGISFLENPSSVFDSNHWLTCIVINSEKTGFTREELHLSMKAANIETRPLWKPMHLQPVFKNAAFYGNGIAENLFNKGLCLPSGPVLTNEDLERVAKVFHKMYKKSTKHLKN